ncbi:MAG TPA: linear amide C-N hydrolase [Firmicutes bacterium]|nr:linear amide C-N hydrolase [Bacillota bacterium]
MEEETQEGQAAKKRAPKWIRITAIVLAAILVVLVALVGAAAIVWRNEIATLSNFSKVADRNDAHQDGAVYRMDVSGDFYFDDFLAQGGASSDAELIDFITNSITRGLIQMEIKQSEIACSAFTAVTPSGDRIFARNYDFAKTNTALVFTDPGDGRYASFSTVDLQFLGMDSEKDVEGLLNKITCLAAPYAPLDGVNEKGLSCGIFMSYQGGELDENGEQITVATDQQTDKPDITSTTMMRAMLDYCATVDEAIAFVQQYDMHDSAQTSFHYMIADATGASAILEWTNGTDATDNDGSARTLHVIRNNDDANIGEREGAADYQWITNFILQPGYYESDADKPGYDRYEHIYGQLSATDGVVENEQAAMDILASVGRRSWNNDDSNGITVHSVVYNLTKKTVLWVANEHYGEAAYTFEFTL